MSELTDRTASGESARIRRLIFPVATSNPPGTLRGYYLLIGLLTFPFYWLAGAALGVPGMRFRCVCFIAGIRLLFSRGHLADAHHCIVSPLDSVRHFEMDFFWRRVLKLRPDRILDVSSPRLLPILLLHAMKHSCADLVNPDGKDLTRTRSMAKGLGVATRCRFLKVRIDELPDNTQSYPLVTCMSVLEHIVDDSHALRIIWDRVAPGGALLLSVPCAAKQCEEYSNVDEYELLDRDAEGFVFWQRYYDESRLQALFAITGPPVSLAVYAERVPGVYDADVLAKRTNPFYPHWREPFATARAYECHDRVAALPGIGVVAMEFVKPAAIDQL